MAEVCSEHRRRTIDGAILARLSQTLYDVLTTSTSKDNRKAQEGFREGKKGYGTILKQLSFPEARRLYVTGGICMPLVTNRNKGLL